MSKNNILKLAPMKVDAASLKKAQLLITEGRAKEAFDLLGRLVSRSPKDVGLLNMAGASAAICGISKEAEAYWLKALAVDPSFIPAYGNLGRLYSESGQLEKAEQILLAALNLAPDYHDARVNLGTLYQEIQRLQEAEYCYMYVLEKQTNHHVARYNLARLYQQQQLLDKAEVEYLRVLELEPNHIDSLYNLGKLYELANKLSKAAEFYRLILGLDRSHRNTLMAFGNLLEAVGNIKDAALAYQRCVDFHKNFQSGYINLGNCLRKLGDHAAAIAAYETAEQLDPSDQYVFHMLATMRGVTTERATNGYVEKVFDAYAQNFENSLVGDLKYKIPAIVRDILKPLVESSKSLANVLDLGCGTGLMGVELSPFSELLVGIDLSEKMLEIARNRNIYNSLIKADIQEFISEQNANIFDIVVATDVFVYIGNLDLVFSDVCRVLKSGGLFVFSIEATVLDFQSPSGCCLDYQLNETGRYSQSLSYISRIADANCFVQSSVKEVVIRLEEGKPIFGYVVVLKKPA